MNKNLKIIGVIPARYASTRFPGKPLADIAGKPMIQRVYEQALKCNLLSKVLVATDDKRIENCVKSFGGNVTLTSPSHPSGTDRCLEAVENESEKFDAVVNIQGDEPFIDPIAIEQLCLGLQETENKSLITLAVKIKNFEELASPNLVKIALANNGKALYFSRSPIPFVRNFNKSEWLNQTQFYRHIGLYAYPTHILKEICDLNPSPLELTESLEQLRWLEHGYSINVKLVEQAAHGVDTPEDLENLKSLA
jgi:3-deoxy-manno-octulosonate cytidylyltransferase (CMP-KDO synthetase)